MNLKENHNLKNIELPLEKCVRHGADVLTNTELLAVILRCGTNNLNVLEMSRQIIDTFSPNEKLSSLVNVSLEELMAIPGIGKVKAAQLLCIFELSKG